MTKTTTTTTTATKRIRTRTPEQKIAHAAAERARRAAAKLNVAPVNEARPLGTSKPKTTKRNVVALVEAPLTVEERAAVDAVVATDIDNITTTDELLVVDAPKPVAKPIAPDVIAHINELAKRAKAKKSESKVRATKATKSSEPKVGSKARSDEENRAADRERLKRRRMLEVAAKPIGAKVVSKWTPSSFTLALGVDGQAFTFKTQRVEGDTEETWTSKREAVWADAIAWAENRAKIAAIEVALTSTTNQPAAQHASA